MKDILKVIQFIIVSLLFCACVDLGGERGMIMGNYYSSATEHYKDGIPCDVKMESNENFGFSSFKNSVKVSVTFFMDESFDFPNLTLDYDVNLEGEWNYKDSLLTVTVDTASFHYKFIGSDAKTPTEQSMVRQIRKNIIREELMPMVRKNIVESSERSVAVIDITRDSIVVEHPLRHKPYTMHRIK